MRFSVLSSGSKANCTFIEAEGKRILIDCGLSATEAGKRLGQLGIPASSIDALLITHEHSDHINGVSVFSRRHKVPVFVNHLTSKFIKKVHGVEIFGTGQRFSLGKLNIHPFSIVHDAADPVGFVIEGSGLRFAQATDLGRVTPLVEESLRGSHALVLESNHDQEMLKNCDYPWELKQRIFSAHGHLCNDSAGTLLAGLSHPDLLHVVLAHISENSNTLQKAHDTVKSYLTTGYSHSLICASVEYPTPLLAVDREKPLSCEPEQLSMGS